MITETPPAQTVVRDRLIRRVVLAVSVVCVAVGVLLGRAVIHDAASAVGDVTMLWWLSLVGLWLVWSMVRAALQKWSLHHVGWRTATVMSEAGEAANWLPIGGFGSFAARTAIGRSRGKSGPELAVAFVLLREGLATGMWLIVAATSIRDVQRGRADALDRLGLVAAATGLTVTAALALVIVRPNRATDWLITQTERIQERVVRRVPRAAGFDVSAFFTTARADAASIIRRRGAALLVLGGITHLVSAAVFWSAIQGVGIDFGLLAVIGIYMPVKAAVGFAPTPNGVGFTEGGLVAALVASGAAVEPSVGGVALYRLITGVAPMTVGAVLYFWWLRSERALRPA